MGILNRVFVVDPDASSREAVRSIADALEIACEEYENGEDFLAAHDGSCRGCLVAEFRLPGISGSNLQERLVADGVPLPTLFITHYADTRRTVRAMRHGALAVLDKPASSQDLWEALWEAALRSQQSYCMAAAHEKFRARLARLSRQERAVLPLLLIAMSNKQIARRLDVSKRTVIATRRQIFKKTRTGSVAELVHMTREANSIYAEHRSERPRAMTHDTAQQPSILDRFGKPEQPASSTSQAELLGGIIHEISQPLQAITSFSSIIEDAARQAQLLDSHKVQEWNQNISKSAQLATDIIDRFRAIVSEEKVVWRDESLESIVQESIQMLQCAAQASHVNIQFEPYPVTVRVDPVQIQQVVINLLKNAIESASNNPTHDREVAVRVVSNGTNAELMVADNGSGISMSEVANIFEPFMSSKQQGLGLGLAISKRIVESHGGHLWYQPNDPRGACFHVKLPLSK